MTEALTLYGYHHSVYTWAARMTLHTTGVGWRDVEVNPFAAAPEDQKLPHPFGRVPVLDHDSFRIYETRAITDYIDAQFGQDRLTPHDLRARARMNQVIGIIDSYAHIPLVRQVFSHSVFRPWANEPSDPDAIKAGLDAATTALSALEDIAAEGLVLTGETLSLADCHLAPMMAYFSAAPAGDDALRTKPALTQWWDRTRRATALAETWPVGPVQKP
ncbi:glutathione S-transferase family protein [uncultured Tateyamaria sp.]|uniref:glutathione S-transferase family protein n=1 Tax=uncultured Tateyamaria sp. TaxID=455651 RepID=UPI00261D1B05|nr:glutathione S-transferase family protein [uncultured Tateyamaria sp.]